MSSSDFKGEKKTMKRIKKAFQKALSAKKAGNKKRAIKAFDKAINLYLNKLGDYGKDSQKRVQEKIQ